MSNNIILTSVRNMFTKYLKKKFSRRDLGFLMAVEDEEMKAPDEKDQNMEEDQSFRLKTDDLWPVSENRIDRKR